MKKFWRHGLFMCALLLVWGADALAATCTSNAGARNWNTAASWNCGHVPATGDSVIVPNGSTVTLNVNTNPLASLQIDAGGTLGIVAGTGFDVYLSGNLTNNGTINFFTSTSTNAIYLVGNNLTSTFSGSGTWELDRIDLNGTGAFPCTGACKVELSGSPNLQFFNATPFSSPSATFTFNALGNSTATVTLALAGAQTIATTGVTYPNLVLTGGNTKTPAAGTVNILGSLTVFAGTTYAGNTNNPAVNLAGNFSNSGTFTSGTGTVTFNGAAAQILGGTAATTFNNLTINKASDNVSIACATPSPTVNATLALTSGDIITAGTSPGCATTCSTQVPIIVAAAGTITGGSSSSYVQGALRKLFSAGATLSYRAAGQDEFPVGDATNYTPVEIAAGTTSTAGNITACVTPTEHPQVTTPPVASGGINAAKSVNRYWSLTTSTINTTAVLVNAIFKFVAGDVDAGAATGNFIVEDWNGTSWFPTTLVAANTSSTQASNIDLTGATNDFAIGEPLSGITAVPGFYDAFETSTSVGILGKIQTKVAGTGFSVDIVHINATKTGVLAGAITVEVRLLDSSGGGALDVNGCNAAWPLIQALPNLNIPASGRGTIAAATVANSYPSVRFQIRSPVGGPYTQIGCSTDLFAIRPSSFVNVLVQDTDWQTAGTTRTLNNTGATGGIVHKAGRPFTLKATAVNAAATTTTNYAGTPAGVACVGTATPLVNVCNAAGVLLPAASACTGTACIGTPGVMTLGAAAAGLINLTTATYNEVGAFTLQLQDQTFANADAVDGTPADCSVTGRYVCGTQNVVGRFVPDHFVVATSNTPQFKSFNASDAACSATPRTFTYIGQPFGYVTVPQALVTAQNAAGATTANYAGALWKIGGAVPSTFKDCLTSPNPNTCQFTTSWSAGGNSSNVIESYTYTLTPVSTPNWDSAGANAAAASVAAGVGTGTITYASSDTLAFLRNLTTPQATFTPNITNTISVQDTSEVTLNGTIATTTAAAFSNIAFDSGNEFRYGRLFLPNSYGTEKLNLTIPLEAQYWTGSIWATNTLDNCTSINLASAQLANKTGALLTYNSTFGPPAVYFGTPATTTATMAQGLLTLTLALPSPIKTGYVDLALNLGSAAGLAQVSCPTTWVAPSPASASGLGLTYLRGQWCSANYDQDPSARITLGISRNKFIFNRENY